MGRRAMLGRVRRWRCSYARGLGQRRERAMRREREVGRQENEKRGRGNGPAKGFELKRKRRGFSFMIQIFEREFQKKIEMISKEIQEDI